MKIIHLKHKEIDKKSYDNVIFNSSCSKIYACSWFLDIVSPNWEILCDESFSYVMPLPKKQKFFINYLTQPYYCQQLGIFSLNNLNETIISDFINHIPYRKYNIQLNECNNLGLKNAELRRNFIIDLNFPYYYLKNHYSTNCIRNIKKAIANQAQIKDISIQKFVDFIDKTTELKILKNTLNLIKEIIFASQKNLENSFLKAVYLNDEIVAAAFIPLFKNRIYYLIPISSKKGKEINAMHLLIDNIIEQYANKKILLDFEGSEIPGLIRFFESFGAIPTYYLKIEKKLFSII